MSEQELITKLNSFKNIKADQLWKDSNRSVLTNQIFGSAPDAKRAGFSWPFIILKELPLALVRGVSRPLAVAVLVLFFAISASAASFFAARGSLPGDSLYLAKIFGEKTQFVFTFNEDEKAKLGMQFASNRAEEITQVMREPDAMGKTQTVENLVNNFKKEISGAKSRLAKISPSDVSAPAGKSQPAKTGGNQPAGQESQAEEENTFFRADIGKDSQGVEISAPDKNNEPVEAKAPTSTPAADAGQAATSSPAKELGTPLEILKQAQVFLDKKDYSATIDKLNEADQAISQVSNETGQVKGESESATTTEEGIKNNKASSTLK